MSAGPLEYVPGTDHRPPGMPVRDGSLARRSGRWLRSYAPTLLLLVCLAGVWELVTRLVGVPSYILPPPDEIARTLWQQRGILGGASAVTIEEMVLGYCISMAVALAIALLLHFSAVARRAVYPLLIGSQTVPVVVLAPILAISLGYDIAPKLVIVALICFFPVVVNTVDGLRSADPEMVRVMRTLHASRWDIFCKVEFPGALPSVFSGARVAATFAAIGAVFGEWSGSTGGLGYVMLQATPQLQTALVFAAIVILTVFSMGLFLVVSAAERLLVPWGHPERELS